MERCTFDNFASNDNKYQLKIQKYLVLQNPQADQTGDHILLYGKTGLKITEPRIAIWEYLEKSDVEKMLETTRNRELKPLIESKLDPKSPKGFPRMVFTEMMYSVMKFCKRTDFNATQTGAILSQFYLTHLFFTSSVDVGPEKLYRYFKDLQMHHSLPFTPHSVKLFSLQEIKDVMVYFCKLYLRNLPLIQFLSLPNIALSTNHYIPPEAPLKTGKGKGGGKKKKK